MTGVEATAASGEFTVDELAARTGLTVRTVRFYASEGLLPPPERRGRVAYYDARHRMRLDLIRTLQEHGYTLAAIERVLARIPHDAAPAEYVVHGAVLAPWLPEQTEILDRHALDRRIGRRLDDELLAYLVEVGAVERVSSVDGGEDSFRTSSGVLGYALEVLELPVTPEFLTESTRIIETHATAVAEGLNEVFARTVWGPYQRGELEHEQVVSLLDRIRPLAIQGLVGAFTRAADQAARRRVEDQ
ncbi:MerR family transcriptional regulator [uncultured Jatrophihabitans sp.]|uniref:MerR family transcriptional regulator n=1 Tax=uncultured Jatrophihabitans sp. TaxID=1610747 RepID=UPI0035CB9B02